MIEEAMSYVDEIEVGRFPPCFADRAAAAAHLERLIVGEEYQTAAERARAQSLVCKLARLKGERPAPFVVAIK